MTAEFLVAGDVVPPSGAEQQNFLDIPADVDALKGQPYRFARPSACPAWRSQGLQAGAPRARQRPTND